jgi:hypothetical protein
MRQLVLDVTSPLTPATILVNHNFDQLEFSPLCHKVGNKEVKEIVDQMLEGDGLTTKHLILPKMFRDMQLLDPMEGSDHDSTKSSNCFIIEGEKRRKMILIAWRWVVKI